MTHMSGLRDVRLKLPDPMLEGIDIAITLGQAATRSDFIRMSIAECLRELTIVGELKLRKLGKARKG